MGIQQRNHILHEYNPEKVIRTILNECNKANKEKRKE